MQFITYYFINMGSCLTYEIFSTLPLTCEPHHIRNHLRLCHIRPWQFVTQSHSGPLVWTCPLVWTWDTRGLRPRNPRVKSVDLHCCTYTWWGLLFPKKNMVVGRLARQTYMQVHNPLFYRCEILSHMWSVFNITLPSLSEALCSQVCRSLMPLI